MVRGNSRAHIEVRFQCCELVIACIHHHRFRERFDYLATCLEEALKFFEGDSIPRLALIALQLARMCIGLEEPRLDEIIVVKDLLAPIVRHLVASGSRATLMNSVTLEFFEHLAEGTNATLVAYIVDKHMSELEKIKYVDTFEKLSANHRQMVKNSRSGPGSGSEGDQQTSSEGDRRENAYWQDDEDEDDEPMNTGTVWCGVFMFGIVRCCSVYQCSY